MTINNVRSMVEELCASVSAHCALVDIDLIKFDILNRSTADNILTQEEKKLYSNCRSIKRKADWLAGRIAAKHAVGKMLDLHPSKMIEILRYETGAPNVTGHCGISVSISHSGSVAVAVAAPFKIGIDLELLESRPESLIRAVLSTKEQLLIADRYGDELTQEVNRFWTCKEAISKVQHWGGSVNFKMIDCCENPVLINGTNIYYKSKSSEIYVVTIAHEGTGVSNG